MYQNITTQATTVLTTPDASGEGENGFFDLRITNNTVGTQEISLFLYDYTPTDFYIIKNLDIPAESAVIIPTKHDTVTHGLKIQTHTGTTSITLKKIYD